MNSPFINGNYLFAPPSAPNTPAPVAYQAVPVIQARTEHRCRHTPAVMSTPLPHQPGCVCATSTPSFTPNPHHVHQPSPGHTIFVPTGPAVTHTQHKVQYQPDASYWAHQGQQTQQQQPFLLTPISTFNATPLPVPHAISTFTPAPQPPPALMTTYTPAPPIANTSFVCTPVSNPLPQPPQPSQIQVFTPNAPAPIVPPFTYMCTPIPPAPAPIPVASVMLSINPVLSSHSPSIEWDMISPPIGSAKLKPHVAQLRGTSSIDWDSPVIRSSDGSILEKIVLSIPNLEHMRVLWGDILVTHSSSSLLLSSSSSPPPITISTLFSAIHKYLHTPLTPSEIAYINTLSYPKIESWDMNMNLYIFYFFYAFLYLCHPTYFPTTTLQDST
ncbi:hypothetical protein ONZ45_g8750 [Pleurotus djamor]|nr:hypothetical protein ONZ45_g8750 [Pleurotus djamor]